MVAYTSNAVNAQHIKVWGEGGSEVLQDVASDPKIRSRSQMKSPSRRSMATFLGLISGSGIDEQHEVLGINVSVD